MGNCTPLRLTCVRTVKHGLPPAEPHKASIALLSSGPQVVAFEDDAAPVQPGATQAYRFKVETSAGPGPNEPGAKLYLYR